MAKESAILEKPKTLEAGWYWSGMLPAEKEVEQLAPTGEASAAGGDVFNRVKASAYDWWHSNVIFGKAPTPFPMWMGKCRHYNSLPSRGFQFNAYSASVSRTEEGSSKFYYPGQISFHTHEEAERIVLGTFEQLVRFGNGVERMMEPTGAPAQVLCLRSGRKPEDWSDDEWQKFRRMNVTSPVSSFDPFTDKWVAEFVYFVRLDAPARPPGFDSDRFSNGQNDWATQFKMSLCPRRFDREFFDHPPKSVAETYGSAYGPDTVK